MEGVTISVSFDVFQEHLSAVQDVSLLKTARADLMGTSSLSPADEQQLLKAFSIATNGSPCCSVDAVRALMSSVLNLSAPVDVVAMNRACRFPDAKSTYHWSDVVAIAKEAKRSAMHVLLEPEWEPSPGQGSKWSIATERLFASLAAEDGAPLIETTAATRFFVKLLPKQRSRAVKHTEVVKQLVPDVMTLDEFERFIVGPLRALLLKEPRPSALPVRRAGSGIATIGLLALGEVTEMKRDTTMIRSSIASLTERQDRASKLRSWVVSNPKQFFEIPPCAMRSTDMWHLQKLRHHLLRSFVVKTRRDCMNSAKKPRSWFWSLLRCVEKAEELMTRHADHCDRCLWMAGGGSIPRQRRGSACSLQPRHSRPLQPTPPSASGMSRVAVPTVPVDTRQPFTPRTCKLPSPRHHVQPLRVNEELLVRSIFQRASEAQLLER